MDSLRKAISSREQAAALIIVLALVVLVTGLVVAYFSRTTSDRPVAHGSFNQSKADQLTQSAMDNIIGDLRQEILNGSGSPSPAPSPVSLFVPTSNANLLPMGSPTPTPGTTPAIPNLVRRSARSDPLAPLKWPDPSTGPALGSRASAVNSTSDVSANGRSITLARWNSHYLVPKSNTLDDKSDPITTGFIAPNYWAPDWVFVTNSGAAVITQPSTSVIGRYAYAIYDEGGLLDMNVTGYPTGTTATQYGRKGPVAFADLTALPYPIPTNPQIDRIVGWRNYGSIQATSPFGTFPNFNFTAAFATNYVNNFVLSNTNGFTAVGTNTSNSQTDQAFLTRQQLIAFRQTTGFAANALQYLGTFSRELNAPSWAPTQDASDMGGNNGAGNIYAYKTNAELSTAINRNLLNVRVINPFTRADGTTAVVGEPLIKRRFPLSRIGGLGPTGPNTTVNSTIVNGALQAATITPNGGTIQRDFGLLWNNANNRWDYVGPSGSTPLLAIETLDQVANENLGREPNFFELLKAAILNGSVGMGSGSSGNTFVAAETKYYSTAAPTSSDYQIMQIGANIISQWDSSNTPTFIYFGTNELAGIKNLPYLNKLVFKPAWITDKGKPEFVAWLLPSLWNPHQNALGSLLPAPAEQDVRIAMTGAGSLSAKITLNVSPFTLTTTTPIAGSSAPFMTVNASVFGTSPSAPTAIVKPPNPPSTISQSTDGYYGFYLPFAQAPTGVTSSNSVTAYPDFGTGCDFQLQVQVNGSWKAYQTWKGCGPNNPLICQPPASSWTDPTNPLQDPEFVTLDPRTLRFGVWGNAYAQSGAAADLANGTKFTLDSPPIEAVTALRQQGTSFSPGSLASNNLYFFGNNTDASVYYTDLDLVQRRGDVTASGTTDEMQLVTPPERPLILNGHFQSVADLGQVFRDQPWKTLSFTATSPNATVKSADAGLLDVFTLHESSMEAGKTSINTRQTPVLTAILSQAIKRVAGTSADLISTAQRNSIITALTTLTSNQLIVNKAELVTRLAADPSVTGLGNKEARECVIRAFSDACQTRTWNLMIDVIAQSGRYPPNASTLAGFLVEGEQHYWVHVAIDRFTGQVIDKQIEVVNE